MRGSSPAPSAAEPLAQVLFEHMAYDDAGNPVTVTLGDYLVPSAAELPAYERVPSETETPINPLGAKGCGESGAIGGNFSFVTRFRFANPS